MIDEATLPARPLHVVAFVRAVDALRLGRQLDVVMAEQKLADRWIEREAVHAQTGRVNEHRRSTVENVAGGHLLAADLHAIFFGATRPRRNLSVNRPDRSDRNIG